MLVLEMSFQVAPTFPGAHKQEVNTVFGAHLHQTSAMTGAVLVNASIQIASIAQVVLGMVKRSGEVQ